MKGVSMIRVKLRPQAECQRRDCGWGQIAGRGATATGVRSLAGQHVKATGHIVHVTIQDITEYAPGRREPTPRTPPEGTS